MCMNVCLTEYPLAYIAFCVSYTYIHVMFVYPVVHWHFLTQFGCNSIRFECRVFYYFWLVNIGIKRLLQRVQQRLCCYPPSHVVVVGVFLFIHSFVVFVFFISFLYIHSVAHFLLYFRVTLFVMCCWYHKILLLLSFITQLICHVPQLEMVLFIRSSKC